MGPRQGRPRLLFLCVFVVRFTVLPLDQKLTGCPPHLWLIHGRFDVMLDIWQLFFWEWRLYDLTSYMEPKEGKNGHPGGFWSYWFQLSYPSVCHSQAHSGCGGPGARIAQVQLCLPYCTSWIFLKCAALFETHHLNMPKARQQVILKILLVFDRYKILYN